jgi:hypothetical protein
MKKYCLACFILTFIVFSGCKKIDKLTQFNMEYNEEVVIPASTGINLPFNILTPDIQSNSESTFAVNNTRKDLVEEIKLTKLELMLTSPTNGDFSFLKSIHIFLSADGLSEIKVAWKESIPASVGKTVILETTSADIKEYIKKDNFKLRLNTVTNKVLASDHKINVYSQFFVDAKILGQ